MKLHWRIWEPYNGMEIVHSLLKLIFIHKNLSQSVKTDFKKLKSYLVMETEFINRHIVLQVDVSFEAETEFNY